MRVLMTVLMGMALSVPAYAETTSYGLTIYSKASPGSIAASQFRPAPGGGYAYGNASAIPGYAVIRQGQTMQLNQRQTTVSLANVAALIDPTTVMFKSLSHPETTHVVEQNYLFDLVSQDALLNRYLGKSITVEQSQGGNVQDYKGTLLSTNGGVTLQQENGQIMTLSNYSTLTFPELPGGLMTKPTLVWDIQTDNPGQHNTEVSYQTDGITWWADYNIIFTEKDNANSGLLDVNAWVSIVNQTGASYPNAKLKLMAGDVQRIQPPAEYMMKARAMDVMSEGAAAPGFEEKAFFEYHLYSLSRPASLPDNATKQLELFPAIANVPTAKEFIFNGQQDGKVGVYLKFQNAKENRMGMPLPAGRVRISKRDTDGSLEFIGEDIIKHTPKDEEVRLKLGSAFDITGERKQLQYHVDTTRKQADETVEITLRNHKDEAIALLVEETLQRYANWEVTQSSDKYEKKDSGTLHFPVKLAKDEEKKLRYTVRYSW